MKTYKKPPNCSDLLLKYSNIEIWQEQMNTQDRNKDLKVQKVQGKNLKGAFAICEVTNTLTNLKNNKDISGNELRFQLSNMIQICTESLASLQSWPLTKDVSTPSEFLFGNNLNDTIGIIQTSQIMLQTYSNFPYYKNSKNLQRFPKNPGNQNKECSSSSSSSSSQTRG